MNLYQTNPKRIVIFLQLSFFAFTVALSIQAAGEVDPTFNASAYNSPAGIINTTAIQPDGKLSSA